MPTPTPSHTPPGTTTPAQSQPAHALIATPETLDFSAGAHGDPDVWFPRLLRLIDDQLEIIRGIEQIDREKSAALDGDDLDVYLSLVNQRQPLIDDLTTLNEAIRPFAERFSVLAANLKDDQRNTIYIQAGRLDQSLHQITLRDTDEAARIAGKREQIARELASIRNGRTANDLYGTPRQTLPPQSLDQAH